MAEQTEKKAPRRNMKVGEVVSTKMAKTIVVRVDMRKPHPLYKRVITRSKKFYAHDEENTCRVGDWVWIEETRPLSRLKRWQLKEIIQRSALAGAPDVNEIAGA